MKAILAQMVSCCVYDKPHKSYQHMHGNILYMFYFWADPVVRLLLLKSYMIRQLAIDWLFISNHVSLLNNQLVY